MYAVIETGGKQYRVEVGTELEVELLDVEPGQSIILERVLLVADGAEAAVGTPVVAGAAVEAEVVGKDRGDKVIAFKYRPKARRRVKKGHRQDHTVLRIADIRFNGRSAAATEAKAEDEKKTERQRLQEAAARQAAEDAALAAKLALGTTPAEESSTPAPKRSKAKATAAPVEADVTDASEADVTEPVVVEPKAPAKRASKARPKAAPATVEAAEGDVAAEPVDPAPADETTKATPRKRTRTKKDE